MAIKAVIFDRDGVLLDTEIVHVESVVKALKELGIIITEKDKKNIFGRHPDDYKEFFTKKYDFNYKKFRKRQFEIYHEDYPKIKPNKEILNLLRELSKKEIKLALTTTSRLKGTEKLLKRLKLEKVFDVVVTFEDIDKRKPYPDPYLKTLKKLGLSAKECIIIEDSPVGVESAKRAKIRCIAFKTPPVKKKELAKAGLITSSAQKIETYLRKLGVKI